MALVPCFECASEVSDRAPACPKCGCAIRVESEVVVHEAGSPEARRERRRQGREKIRQEQDERRRRRVSGGRVSRFIQTLDDLLTYGSPLDDAVREELIAEDRERRDRLRGAGVAARMRDLADQVGLGWGSDDFQGKLIPQVVDNYEDLAPKESGASSPHSRLSGGLPDLDLKGVSSGNFQMSQSNLLEARTSETKRLKLVLDQSNSVIDRHFARLAIEQHLYKSRDIDPSALTEFDTNCTQHHNEMDEICSALMREWGQLPDLWIYSQCSIRWNKSQDFVRSAEWCALGASVYRRWDPNSEFIRALDSRLQKALRRSEGNRSTPANTSNGSQRVSKIELSFYQCMRCGKRDNSGLSDLCSGCGLPFS